MDVSAIQEKMERTLGVSVYFEKSNKSLTHGEYLIPKNEMLLCDNAYGENRPAIGLVIGIDSRSAPRGDYIVLVNWLFLLRGDEYNVETLGDHMAYPPEVFQSQLCSVITPDLEVRLGFVFSPECFQYTGRSSMIGVDGIFFCRYMVLDDMILDDRGIRRSVLKLPVQNRRTSYLSLDLLNSNRSTQSSLYWSLINRVQSLVKHILSSSSENQRLQGSTKIHMVWPHWIMIVEALEMEPVKIYGQVTLHLLMENLSQKALRTNDEKYMVRINSVDGIKKLS